MQNYTVGNYGKKMRPEKKAQEKTMNLIGILDGKKNLMNLGKISQIYLR